LWTLRASTALLPTCEGYQVRLLRRTKVKNL
jgi:hypothetical protein